MYIYFLSLAKLRKFPNNLFWVSPDLRLELTTNIYFLTHYVKIPITIAHRLPSGVSPAEDFDLDFPRNEDRKLRIEAFWTLGCGECDSDACNFPLL